jgi:uncharacterized protein (DUF4213/DUF364 family)
VEDTILSSSEIKTFKFKASLDQLEKEEIPTDILFCTGTTLINNSLESILERFKKKARKIVLIGPTASMIPDILFDYGVDIVGGMEIYNLEAALQVIQEGGGTMLFKKYGKKYNLMKE